RTPPERALRPARDLLGDPPGVRDRRASTTWFLSRASVKAGPALIELQNVGQDPHDLRLRRIGRKRTYAIALTDPGKRRTVSLRLLPGRYRLWCSVADHAQLGMQAMVRVRR